MDPFYATLFHVIFGAYCLLLALAAVTDMRRFVIPNIVVVALVVLFVAAGLVLPIQIDWLSHLGAALAVFAGGVAVYALGKLGAGDVKLLTAVALWMGFEFLPQFLLYVAIMGGVVTLALMALRRAILGLRVTLPALEGKTLPRVLLTGEHIPYALAIAPIAIYMGFSLPYIGVFLNLG